MAKEQGSADDVLRILFDVAGGSCALVQKLWFRQLFCLDSC